MSLPASITAIGNAVVLQYSRMERVSGLTNAGIEVAGTSATRIAVAEFRWSTDGATWSPWLAFTTPMLEGLVLDANDGFYIEVRVTRDGTDNTGVITWTLCTFDTTIDEQATVGAGRISQENLHGDTIAAWIAIIQSWVWQVNGADHYFVDYKPRFWDFNTTKPTIYLHGLTQLDTDADVLGQVLLNAQISIGIKPVKNKTVDYDKMLSRLLAVFNPYQYGDREWTFDFKGVRWINTKLPDFGIKIEAVSGFQEFEDAQAGQFWHEFTVSFAIESSNFTEINS